MNTTTEPTRERAFDPARLRRAVQILPLMEALGPGEFVIHGRRGDRYVNLNSDQPCDCEDCWYRGRRIQNQCKHTLAARLRNFDPTLVQSLGDMLLAADKLRIPDPTTDE